MATRNFDFSVLTQGSPQPIGRVIVGVPDDQMLALKKVYPDRQFTGEDPRVQFSIRVNVSDTAKIRIADILGNRGVSITLKTQDVPTFDLLPDRPPTFTHDGKNFWVLPWKS